MTAYDYSKAVSDAYKKAFIAGLRAAIRHMHTNGRRQLNKDDCTVGVYTIHNVLIRLRETGDEEQEA